MDWELPAPIFNGGIVNEGFAGIDILIFAAWPAVEILRYMGLSAPGPLGITPIKSGAANQNVVSNCAFAFNERKQNRKTVNSWK